MRFDVVLGLAVDFATAIACGLACLLLYKKIGHRAAFTFGMLLFGLAALAFFFACQTLADIAGDDLLAGLRMKAYGSVALAAALFLLVYFNVRTARLLCALDWTPWHHHLWLALAFLAAIAVLLTNFLPAPVPSATGLIPLGLSLAVSALTMIRKKAPLLNQIPRGIRFASLATTTILIPLVFLDSFGVHPFAQLSGLSLPIYLTIAIGLFGVAGYRLFDQPSYADGGRLSPYFIDRFGLSKRETEVAELAYQGLAVAGISDRLSVSPKTVENHLYHIYQKTRVKSRVELYQLIRSMGEDLMLKGRAAAD